MSIFKAISKFFGFIPAGIKLYDVGWTCAVWHSEDVMEYHSCLDAYARGLPGEKFYLNADEPSEEE